jgi:hypothetical protein
VRGAAERRLGINDPVLAIKLAQETGEALAFSERDAVAEEA